MLENPDYEFCSTTLNKNSIYKPKLEGIGVFQRGLHLVTDASETLLTAEELLPAACESITGNEQILWKQLYEKIDRFWTGHKPVGANIHS